MISGLLARAEPKDDLGGSEEVAMTTRSGRSHEARKTLFSKGVRRGWVSLSEIDEAVPEGALSPSERWLLFYSLRAAGVEIRDDSGEKVEGDKEVSQPEA